MSLGQPPTPPLHPPTGWPPPPAPPPAPGSTRGRSVGPWLLAAALLLGAALGAVLALRGASGPDHPDAWDPRVADLVEFVERERGMTFLHPVHVEFLDDDSFRAEVTDREDPTEEDEAELESLTASFRALGLVSGEIDLLEVGDTLLGEGIVGFYAYEDERIVVRGSALDDEARSTLVHELTHALQDQHFDLAGREHETSGESAAFTAVVEADAVLVERAWVDTLPADQQAALQEAELAGAEGAELDGVPEVFVELLAYPYVFGPDFLDQVIEARGQAGRDEVLTDPPTTERHIILPETYLAGEGPTEVATPELRDGETAIEDSDGDLGMLSLLVVLTERIDFAESWSAVQGWEGDAIVAFERDGITCVRGTVAFTDPAGASAFATAFTAWADGAPAGSRLDGDEVEFESCDPGTDADLGRQEGHVSAIQGLALRRALITELVGSGASATTAACISDGLIEALTANRFVELDELLSTDPTNPAAEEIHEALGQLLLSCP